MMATYALVNKSGIVENILLWDKNKDPDYDYGQSNGYSLALVDDGVFVSSGYSFSEGFFTAPTPTEEDQQAADDQKTSNNISMKESLISVATQAIVVYQTKLLIGRKLTDKETNILNSWLDYIDALEAIDAETSDVIAWPASP